MVQLNPNFFPGGQSPLLPAGQTPVNTTPVDTTTSALAEQSLLMRYMEKTGLSPVMPGWTNPSEAEMLAVVEGREFRRTALKEFGNASYMTVYVDDGSRVPGGESFLSAKDIPYFKKGIVDFQILNLQKQLQNDRFNKNEAKKLNSLIKIKTQIAKALGRNVG